MLNSLNHFFIMGITKGGEMGATMRRNDSFKNKSRERIIELIEEFCGSNVDRKQQSFADMCGVSKFSISQYVNGTNAPGNITAAKIARKCNVDPLWVMGFDVPKHGVEKPQQQKYYINEETARKAQEAFDDPNLRVLFDAADGAKPEDIQMAADLLKRLKGTNPNG